MNSSKEFFSFFFRLWDKKARGPDFPTYFFPGTNQRLQKQVFRQTRTSGGVGIPERPLQSDFKQRTVQTKQNSSLASAFCSHTLRLVLLLSSLYSQ